MRDHEPIHKGYDITRKIQSRQCDRTDLQRGRRSRGMSKIRLKPCPFCGGEAEVIENITNPNPKMHTFNVECTKCLVQMGRDSMRCSSRKGNLFFWSEEEAAEAWNRRQDNPQKKESRMEIHDVVQFTEKHKWSGCLGIITEDRGEGHPRRYIIGVPVPMQGTAYIFDDGGGIERIGKAVMVEKDE